MLRTTLAFTMAKGSGGINVIPDEAYVIGNMRTAFHQDVHASIAAIKPIAQKYDIEIEVLDGGVSSGVSDFNSDVFHQIEKALKTAWSSVDRAVPYIMTGASDSRYFDNISDNCFRFLPFLIDEQQLNSIHGVNENVDLSKRSFIIAIAIIFALMVMTYILTLVVPGGEYARTVDANGNTIIDTAGGFRYVTGGLPFWKWLLSPFLVLGAEGNGTVIAVMVFLLVIGGVFNSLNCCGLMQYMLVKIVYRFGHVRYTLMAVLTVFFMAMGLLVGSFEEVIPMVPIVVALSVSLGWDAVTGLAMSLLAAGCGFAAGVANPFTIGVAQGLAGLPTFSGMCSGLYPSCLYTGFCFFSYASMQRKQKSPFRLPRKKAVLRKTRVWTRLCCISPVYSAQAFCLYCVQAFCRSCRRIQ